MRYPRIRNADGNWARNSIQKANRFAEHLKNTLQSNEGNKLPNWSLPGRDSTIIRPIYSKENANEI